MDDLRMLIELYVQKGLGDREISLLLGLDVKYVWLARQQYQATLESDFLGEAEPAPFDSNEILQGGACAEGGCE